MKELLVPMDRAGRIVLPKRVRQELAIKPGDVFKIAVQGAAVTLTPEREAARFVRKGKALVFSSRSRQTLSTQKVNEILEASREEPGAQRRGE